MAAADELTALIANCWIGHREAPKSETQLLSALRSLFNQESWPIDEEEQARTLGTDMATLVQLIESNPHAGRLLRAPRGFTVLPPENSATLSDTMKRCYQEWFAMKTRRISKQERRAWDQTKQTFKSCLKKNSRRRHAALLRVPREKLRSASPAKRQNSAASNRAHVSHVPAVAPARRATRLCALPPSTSDEEDERDDAEQSSSGRTTKKDHHRTRATKMGETRSRRRPRRPRKRKDEDRMCVSPRKTKKPIGKKKQQRKKKKIKKDVDSDDPMNS
eukprot:GEMP01028933.1.p1 GENE.GEMP01028933.1~~GEMP01028933.1.p1  ORF type:complete len:276 (+),score=74.02 GEMP01028933.1:68-895(+)